MIELANKISINNNDIRYNAVRSSGPGGQHVNKVSTAIILKLKLKPEFYPKWFIQRLKKISGKQITKDGTIIIKAKNYRSQARNKKDAFERLVSLFSKAAERPKLRKKTKMSKKTIEARLKNKKIKSQKKLLRKKIDISNE